MNILILLSLIGGKNFLEWNHFKDAHLKTYTSLKEEIHRIGIYHVNKRMIEEHNFKYDMGLKSYKLEINEFGDLRDDEFQELYLSEGLGGHRGAEVRELKDGRPPPSDWDWRRVGAVTPVLHQGRCGSCWAFSATGALETQVYLKTGALIPLSNQQLLDCTGRYRNHGCRGGMPRNAYRYMLDSRGIGTEKAYPYEAKENRRGCKYHGEASVFTNITSFARLKLGDEQQLALAVAHIGTISVCMYVSKEFKFYKHGVFYEPSCPRHYLLNHAMLLVGYGVTASGENYWLVKNSWGTKWGKDGYIMMAKDKGNNCNIASDSSYPILAGT